MPHGLVFLRNFAGLVNEALPASAVDKPLEVWFQE
jgi:hypothetical protein